MYTLLAIISYRRRPRHGLGCFMDSYIYIYMYTYETLSLIPTSQPSDRLYYFHPLPSPLDIFNVIFTVFFSYCSVFFPAYAYGGCTRQLAITYLNNMFSGADITCIAVFFIVLPFVTLREPRLRK